LRRVNQNNIANSPYTSQDTDASPDVVEQSFANVNLNPLSSRYIERVIGNRFQTINGANEIVITGDYPNLSQYVRVEVDPAVASATISNTLIPFGFRAMNSAIPNVSGSVNLAPITYKTDQLSGTTYSSATHFGFDFTNAANLAYLAPIPTSGSTTASNADFYLGNVSQALAANFPSTSPYVGTLEAALTAGTFTDNVYIETRKFIVPFQGGFDGTRPNLPKFTGANITSTNTLGFDCSTTSATGTVAYRKALTLLSNTDQYDINMLITPGIIDSLHSAVTTEARNLCANTRYDTFYVMDSNPITDSISTVVNQVTTIDNNYTATYWPWVRIINPSNNVPTWVPPSVVIPGALSFNDTVAAPWYAPAGLTRGGLTTVNGTYQNLNQSNRDTLYEARVNPIANFPNEGVVIWGQKTLQALPSALDRVNVRRLLITVKKFIASASRYLVFDPNDQTIRDKFLAIVNPYLEQVRAQRGLTAFRVVMDNTNNTPQTIDQNILYGKLFLQPTRTAEFIILDFNIQPTGAAFPE
jgi:phage tail sheath protein FI